MSKLAIVKVKLDREVNGYVVSCSSTKDAVVIDPGEPADKVAGQLDGLSLRWILATHGHTGHMAGKLDLQEIAGGQTGMHMADAKLFLKAADLLASRWRPIPAVERAALGPLRGGPGTAASARCRGRRHGVVRRQHASPPARRQLQPRQPVGPATARSLKIGRGRWVGESSVGDCPACYSGSSED